MTENAEKKVQTIGMLLGSLIGSICKWTVMTWLSIIILKQIGVDI